MAHSLPFLYFLSMRYSAIRTVFILLLVCGVIGGWTVYSEVHRASTSDEALTFTIENGQGVREIGSSLFDSGVIRSELVFRRYVSKKGIDKQRTIAVGDSISTDIKGATDFGIDSLLVHSSQRKAQSSFNNHDPYDPTYSFEI